MTPTEAKDCITRGNDFKSVARNPSHKSARGIVNYLNDIKGISETLDMFNSDDMERLEKDLALIIQMGVYCE